MTKIDIISGFLGAGKTTLIKKLLKESLKDEKVVLIENEFGEIGIDGGFLKEAGIDIKEMNSGCICCTLVGDFGTSLNEVLETYHPERIIIEPSGVGKLSDVMKAVENLETKEEIMLNSRVAVVDAGKCKLYTKNFGEFFINQITYAQTIILSRTQLLSQEKVEKAIAIIREHNPNAKIITTPWEELTGQLIMEAIESYETLEEQLLKEVKHEHEHHEGCGCGHDHHDHEHHEHEHHDGCGCGHDHDEHEHHEGCGCGHDHHEHEHHHADEVFGSWGLEGAFHFSKEAIKEKLTALEDEEQFGIVLRAKGMVPAEDGSWTYFDYVPGEMEIRQGNPDYSSKICVIGSMLNEENLKQLFS